jgi:MFS transporter, DHA1 family, multidrug resistance protein
VVLAAAVMSTQGIAIDAMLPALPSILGELHVAHQNDGQWVVSAYLIGIGVGYLFWGMISDRFGRRPILLGGLALYIASSALCAWALSFEAFLLLRAVEGLAAASAVVMRSVIRDLYSGRHMARVMSLTIVVILIVPVIAPGLGQLLLLAASWRAMFLAIGGLAALVWTWVWLRLPETLHPEYRLPLNAAHVRDAVWRVVGTRVSLWYTLATTAVMGSLIAYIGMVEQIFADIFHRPSLMPILFAVCATAMAGASLLNSRIVERFGMRRISHGAMLLFIGVAAVHVLVVILHRESLWTFVLLQAATLAAFSLAASNFGAMAMEPLGSIAGTGASLQGFISTSAGAVVGSAIGRHFNGSILVVPLSTLRCGLLGLVCILIAEKGRLFRPQHAAE